MLTSELEEEISTFSRELKGKLNEMLLLILLIKNYDAAIESKNTRSFGFRGRKDRQLVKEGLTTAIVAKELNMNQSTVGTTVNRLSKRNLVRHSKGKPIITTEDGRAAAREQVRHHRLIEVWLTNSLGLSPDSAHSESIKLMLLTNCEMINTIAKRYGNPDKCPCGEDIPESELCGNSLIT
ncbi:MAG: metal-dependent transcriptional regulator [Candidatus Kariarchaeaceae archaeon]